MGSRSGFASAVVRLRYAIVALWIAGAVVATVALPTIDEAQTGALGDLVPTDAQAVDAEIRAYELFGFPLSSRTVVVQRDADGLDAAEQTRVVERAVAINRGTAPGLGRIAGALPVTNAIGGRRVSPERSTVALTYLLFGPDVDRHERARLGNRLVARIRAREHEQIIGLTGVIPARDAQADAIAKALPLVEAATVALVALVVALHFRALLAPLVVLGSIAVAYLVSMRVMAGMGEAVGLSVPSEVEPVVVVLLFGVVTDYAIFFLSRFRQRLLDAGDARTAARRTVADLQGTILTAGLIVAAASASLALAQLGFLQAFGPGVAVAILVALAVSTTFLPALMTTLGAAVFWPSRPGRELSADAASEEPRGRLARSRLVRFAARRPWTTIAACGAVLLLAASGLTRLDLGQTLIRGLPEDAEARQAYRAAAAGFAPGVLSPTTIVIEREGIARRRDALRALQRRIDGRAGIAQVVGPAQQPVERNLGAVYSGSGDAVRLLVVLDSDPLGARAIDIVRKLKRDLPGLLRRVGLPGAKASVAGDTALAGETVDESTSDLARIAPVALLVVYLLLAAFLRALVAPLYLVGASVLSLAASLGLTAYVFQELLGYGELTFFVPFGAAVLLVALGSDYNVFLAGRIWLEAARRPLREAVVVGGARAATAIAVAGIVLALSFALLALVPVRAFHELAFAMAVGLLIDAFLVRTLLVPALVAVVGPPGGWPGGRLLRRYGRTGAATSTRSRRIM